jgi:CRP/FNR family transcriptional regulator, cyclic AMP receptor protein
MSLSEKASFLKSIPLFSSLAIPDVESLGNLCHERNIPKEQFIFHESDSAEYLFIIKRGIIKILKHSECGKNLTIRLVSTGGLIGEVSMFDNKPYPASAQAIEDSIVYELSRHNHLRFAEKHPAVSLNIIGTLVHRLREAYTIMQGLATEHTGKRVAMTLLTLAETTGQKEGGNIRLTLRLNRQDLAEMAGCTKESVSRVMAHLKREGVIRPESGKILILAPDRLKAALDLAV